MLRNQLTTKTVMKINYTYCVAPFLKVTNFAIQAKSSWNLFNGILKINWDKLNKLNKRTTCVTTGLKPIASYTNTYQVNKFYTKSTNIVATEKGHLVMAYINICT